MTGPDHGRRLSVPELEAGLAHILGAPRDHGRLELLVRRPAVDTREVLAEGVLTTADGLVGDSWRRRGGGRTGDGADPDKQLNIMSWRVVSLLAPDPRRRPLAGDQLYIDLDLSLATLPAGSRLAIGAAMVEVTEAPHRGCAKFAERFGLEALRFVNSPVGRQLRLRGLNARVIVEGTVRPGDAVTRVQATGASGTGGAAHSEA